MPDTLPDAAAAMGRKGGRARIASMTPEQFQAFQRSGAEAAGRYWRGRTPEQRAEHGRKIRAGIERARRLREAAAKADAGCPEHGRDHLTLDGDLCLADGCDWMAEDGAA
jgi:hypothetical protein